MVGDPITSRRTLMQASRMRSASRRRATGSWLCASRMSLPRMSTRILGGFDEALKSDITGISSNVLSVRCSARNKGGIDEVCPVITLFTGKQGNRKRENLIRLVLFKQLESYEQKTKDIIKVSTSKLRVYLVFNKFPPVCYHPNLSITGCEEKRKKDIKISKRWQDPLQSGRSQRSSH